MKALRILWKTLAALVGAALVLLLLAAIVWRGELRTMASVHQVDGNPFLYVVDYQAPYDLDDLVAHDIDTYPEVLSYGVSHLLRILEVKMDLPQLGEASVNCTSFQAAQADGDGYWFGRNYDYYENPTLVTFTHPKKGYASMAVCDMSFMGYSPQHLPLDFIQRINTLFSVYVPLDGINEKGFCASILALPGRFASQQDTPRHDVGTSTVLRLLLDRCATVEEALALLETVDVRHDNAVSTGFQYMIADAGGDCAVFAFDPEDAWKLMVVRKPQDRSFLHVTNHVLAPKYRTDEPDPSVGNPGSRSWWRYASEEAFLAGRGGAITREEAQECLASVRWVDLPVSEGLATGTQYQLSFHGLRPVVEKMPDRIYEDTQYSNVYDQRNLTLWLRNWNDYEVTHTFSLR